MSRSSTGLAHSSLVAYTAAGKGISKGSMREHHESRKNEESDDGDDQNETTAKHEI